MPVRKEYTNVKDTSDIPIGTSPIWPKDVLTEEEKEDQRGFQSFVSGYDEGMHTPAEALYPSKWKVWLFGHRGILNPGYTRFKSTLRLCGMILAAVGTVLVSLTLIGWWLSLMKAWGWMS